VICLLVSPCFNRSTVIKMEKYNHYTIQDFVWDDYFRQWILSPTTESNAHWEVWLSAHPHKRQEVQEAVDLVRAMQIKEPTISNFDIELLVHKTLEIVENSSPNLQYTEGVVRNGAEAGIELDTSPLHLAFYHQAWFKIAASVVLIVGIGIGFWAKNIPLKRDIVVGDMSVTTIEKTNNTDTAQVIKLSDGSLITLSKGSVLRYDSVFKGDKREVFLSGEAFFEVAKNAEKPFLVYANKLVTKVLGTSFSIKANQEDQEVIVEVKTGKVSVFTTETTDLIGVANQPNLKGLIVTPNQKIVFNRSLEQLTKTLVEKPEIMLPKNEKQTISFDFDDTPAHEVFEILKKAYSINIVYDETVLKDCPVTAPLTDQSLYDKLKIICKAINAKYEILDGQIIIQSRGCK
jgi:transmembrane sensor